MEKPVAEHLHQSQIDFAKLLIKQKFVEQHINEMKDKTRVSIEQFSKVNNDIEEMSKRLQLLVQNYEQEELNKKQYMLVYEKQREFLINELGCNATC